MQATKETAVIAYLARARSHWGWLPCSARHSALGSRRAPLAVVAPGTRRSGCTYCIAHHTAVLVLHESRGAIDGVLTYVPWLSRAGGQSPHIHPWHFYLHRLVWWRHGDGPVWSEGLIVGLALIGCVAAWLPRSSRLGDVHVRFVRWLTCYTIAVTAIYTVIPYKTPWCLLQFLLGMVLLAGVGASVLLACARRLPLRVALGSLLLLGAGHLAWQAYRASYVWLADVRNPYVYAQTSVGAVQTGGPIAAARRLRVAKRYDTPIKVIWSDPYYWPLPWYTAAFCARRVVDDIAGRRGGTRRHLCAAIRRAGDPATGRDPHHDWILRAPPAGPRPALGAARPVGRAPPAEARMTNDGSTKE